MELRALGEVELHRDHFRAFHFEYVQEMHVASELTARQYATRQNMFDSLLEFYSIMPREIGDLAPRQVPIRAFTQVVP